MVKLNASIAVIVALASCCISFSSSGHENDSFLLTAARPAASPIPGTVNPKSKRQVNELVGQLAGKRAIFVGEIHDRLEHHQNQLRIIKALYARYPDMAIGVEYFQRPFQRYLDDYIAGHIDEREMLRKTEYFKRWQLDYRLVRPIFEFAREKHIPVLALNVPDEIHTKVFRSGMKSLDSQELAQIPDYIQPASEHYLNRLQSIFDSHPASNDFGNFVEGVLLWDESMADTAARYLKEHPGSRVVVLAGMVHVMYGDGIPERVNLRLGSNESAILINGNTFGSYHGIADFQLATKGNIELPKAGKLGVTIIDDPEGVRVSKFTAGSAAQDAGIAIGDRIVALDGVKVANLVDLKTMLFDKKPGEKILVAIQRYLSAENQKEMQFEVALR